MSSRGPWACAHWSNTRTFAQQRDQSRKSEKCVAVIVLLQNVSEPGRPWWAAAVVSAPYDSKLLCSCVGYKMVDVNFTPNLQSVCYIFENVAIPVNFAKFFNLKSSSENWHCIVEKHYALENLF